MTEAQSTPLSKLDRSSGAESSKLLHRFTWVVCIATFLLICVGSLVTSFGVGMAVPDWPTTYGQNMFTYNWFNSPSSGVFIEHGHRLLASLVGLMTLVLAIWIWVAESRSWLRKLGVIALVAVCVQGVLGGLRVVQINHNWGIVHGALAQGFFALTASLVFFTSATKQSSRISAQGDVKKLRRIAIVTTAMIYLQIVLGSFVRHTGTGVIVHLVVAVGVFAHLFLLGKRIFSEFSGEERLVRLMAIASALTLLQLLLGLGAWATTYADPTGLPVRGASLQVLIGSLHVAVGALLLAVSLYAALTSYSLSPKEKVA